MTPAGDSKRKRRAAETSGTGPRQANWSPLEKGMGVILAQRNLARPENGGLAILGPTELLVDSPYIFKSQRQNLQVLAP